MAVQSNEGQSRKRLPEVLIEWTVFNARWLLAPLYLGLIVALVVILVKFMQTLVSVAADVPSEDLPGALISVLQLLDIALLGNLVILVMFVGYDSFVSRINTARGSEDRPTWLGTLGFSGMKLKLIGSIVAISMIELLRDFIGGQSKGYPLEGWRIGLHLVFVVSGVLFALSDVLASRVRRVSEED